MPSSSAPRPCRLCGTATAAAHRVCWPCRQAALDQEAEATGCKAGAAEALHPPWEAVIGRRILRRAVRDRACNGLSPLGPAEAVVIEFAFPEAKSRFATVTTAAFEATDLEQLRRGLALGPPVPGERLLVHDGRELFSAEATERVRAALRRRPATRPIGGP